MRNSEVSQFLSRSRPNQYIPTNMLRINPDKPSSNFPNIEIQRILTKQTSQEKTMPTNTKIFQQKMSIKQQTLGQVKDRYSCSRNTKQINTTHKSEKIVDLNGYLSLTRAIETHLNKKDKSPFPIFKQEKFKLYPPVDLKNIKTEQNEPYLTQKIKKNSSLRNLKAKKSFSQSDSTRKNNEPNKIISQWKNCNVYAEYELGNNYERESAPVPLQTKCNTYRDQQIFTPSKNVGNKEYYKSDRKADYLSNRKDSLNRLPEPDFPVTRTKVLKPESLNKAKIQSNLKTEINNLLNACREKRFHVIGSLVRLLSAHTWEHGLELWLNFKDIDGFGLVHHAIQNKLDTLLMFLKKEHADFNLKDSFGITPLMMLATDPWPEFYELIIENVSDLNVQDSFGNTVLHYAVVKKNMDLIIRLLESKVGLEVRIKNQDQVQPIDLADNSILIRLETLFRKYEKKAGHPHRQFTSLKMRDNHNNREFLNCLENDIQKSNGTQENHNQNLLDINFTLNESSIDDQTNTNKYQDFQQNKKVTEKNREKSKSKRVPFKILLQKTYECESQISFEKNTSKFLKVNLIGKSGSLANKKKSKPIGGQLLEKSNTEKKDKNISPVESKSKYIYRKQDLDNNKSKDSGEAKKIKPQFKKLPSNFLLPKRNLLKIPEEIPKNQNRTAPSTTDLFVSQNNKTIDYFNKNGNVPSKNIDTYSSKASTAKNVSVSSFRVHSIMGTGSFGKVYLVQKKDTSVFYAMKCLSKEQIFGNNLQRYATTERNVLRVIDHPFIIKLRFSFQNAHYLFLVMDFMPGGDLGFYLEREQSFSEKRTKIYAAEIILAISELHKHNIIFRDLKPDNILLDGNGHIMLSDFGLSKENVRLENNEKSFCGTFAYLAPEMIKKSGHGKAMDWYSLGALLYEMVMGMPPYYSEDKSQLFDNIKFAELKFSIGLSMELRILLTKLLERDPKKRIKEEAIKTDPWFKEINWQHVYLKHLIPPKPIINKRPLNQFLDIENIFTESNVDVQNIKDWTFVEA